MLELESHCFNGMHSASYHVPGHACQLLCTPNLQFANLVRACACVCVCVCVRACVVCQRHTQVLSSTAALLRTASYKKNISSPLDTLDWCVSRALRVPRLRDGGRFFAVFAATAYVAYVPASSTATHPN